MHIRTQPVEPGALPVLPWWTDYRRDTRKPRLAVRALFLYRPYFLESRGTPRPRCTATTRDGTECALRCSFRPQPVASPGQRSGGAIAAPTERSVSARCDCARGTSS